MKVIRAITWMDMEKVTLLWFKDTFIVNQSVVLPINPDNYRDGENDYFCSIQS